MSQTGLIMMDQIDADPFRSPIFNRLSSLIFVNSDIMDAVMLSLIDASSIISTAEYGVLSVNHTNHWIRSSFWRDLGALVLGGDTLTTQGKNSISLPFTVSANGKYDVWMRIGFAGNRGELSVSIDGSPIGVVQPLSPSWERLKWIKLNAMDLESGGHTITLRNDGTGFNDLDLIAIMEQDEVQARMTHLIDTLTTFPGRLIFVLEAENTFVDLPKNWHTLLHPYEGYVLHTKYPGTNLAPEGTAFASSEASESYYQVTEANDGDPLTRWSSNPEEPMPQWLQIEWDTPQEIVGVNLLFEYAFAEAYMIQIWNGSNWVDQVNVTDNAMLERYHHISPVNTTKVRINVSTSHLAHVSLWELEVYKPKGVSTELALPIEGQYMFTLRLASGQEHGTVNFQINDVALAEERGNLQQEPEWKYYGPIYLNAGSHTITVDGNIDFDQLLVYQLMEGEQIAFLQDVFKPNNAPQISYDQINPCEYVVHVHNITEPFLLVFSDSFHQLWKAYIDGVETSAISLYGMVNGFNIEKTGSFDVVIYFTGQTFANIGLTISTITLLLVLGVLLLPSVKIIKWKNKLRKRFDSVKSFKQ
jgi:hypothetical protein